MPEEEREQEQEQVHAGRAARDVEDAQRSFRDRWPGSGGLKLGSPIDAAVADSAPNLREVESGLGELSQRGFRAQARTFAGLGGLVGVAGLAVAGGVIASNPIFWAAAGSVFFLASAGLSAWAAKQLGIFAEMAELFRVKVRAAEAEGGQSKEAPEVDPLKW